MQEQIDAQAATIRSYAERCPQIEAMYGELQSQNVGLKAKLESTAKEREDLHAAAERQRVQYEAVMQEHFEGEEYDKAKNDRIANLEIYARQCEEKNFESCEYDQPYWPGLGHKITP